MAEITQAQYDAAKQTHRKIYVHINLLSFQKQVIESIEGRVTNGSLTSDANSNMRNTCDIEMVVTDSSFNIENEGKIWIDRFIQIYIGVEDVFSGEVVWTNKGLYLLNQPTYGYDAVSKMLSFQGVDLMALFTEMRNGMLAEAYVIPAETNVRQVITTIVTMNGFNEYVIEECRNSDGSIQPVPYDMEFDVGATWWDVLESLQSILPNYQMYFDVDGVFHYEPTPYKANEPVRMNDDIWMQNVISESVSYDFESVKNHVKVLGRTHSVNYYSTSYNFYKDGPFIHVEGDPNEYRILSLNVPGVPQQPGDGTLIGFVANEDLTGPFFLWVGGEDIATGRLLEADGTPVTQLFKEEYWVFSYKSPQSTGRQFGDWTFLGHVQAVGEWMDDNPRSPFFVGNPAGEIKIVLYGGDYDNIMSDDLAKQRAEWEIYQRCRMNDSITLTSIPIYWAEVNWMVSYTPLGQQVVNQYLISSITTDLTYDGTQTYNLIRWYPYYIQYVPITGKVMVDLNVGGKCKSSKAISSKSDVVINSKIGGKETSTLGVSLDGSKTKSILNVSGVADSKIIREADGLFYMGTDGDFAANNSKSTSISANIPLVSTEINAYSVGKNEGDCHINTYVDVSGEGSRNYSSVARSTHIVKTVADATGESDIPSAAKINEAIIATQFNTNTTVSPASQVNGRNSIETDFSESVSNTTSSNGVDGDIGIDTSFMAEPSVEGTIPTSRFQQYIQGVIEHITQSDTAPDTSVTSYSTAIGETSFCCNQKKLIDIEINNLVDAISYKANAVLYNCPNLQRVKFPSSLKKISASIGQLCGGYIADFTSCRQVPTLMGYSTTSKVPVLGTVESIEVPNSLLNSWKTAAGWSSVADKIIGV